MHDPKLYDQIKQFCKDGIEYASKQLAKLGDKTPTRIAEKFLIVDDHTTSHQQDVVIDWSRLIFSIEKNLQKLDSYKNAATSLNSHRVFSRQLNTLVGTASFMRRIETDELLLRSLLTSLFMESNEAIFDEERLKKLYEKMENWFYSKTLRYKYFAPISNFSMEQDRLKLAPGFAIVKITKEEKERLLSISSAFHSTFPILASKEYAFEFITDQPKYIGDRPENPEERLQPQNTAQALFRDASSALRLYKPSLIGFNHVWILDTLWEFPGIHSTSSNAGPVDYVGDHMKLEVREIPEFLTLWKRYKKVTQRSLKKILSSVSRLNFGTERGRAEDKLVDYYVGFESLFLNDNNPELSYRLALLVAHWLGVDHTDRKKIYTIIKEGYDQRSTIVHGGEPEKTIKVGGRDISFTEHTKLIEEYLRLAIKKFIVECADNDKNETQLVEELRDRILK